MSKILIVEDDTNIAFVLRTCLESGRHNVDVMERGMDALAVMRHGQHELIVLDWNLPDISGVEVCKLYRDAGGTKPILMLTAKGTSFDKATGLDAGADDYLVKPFDPTELLARIRALLRRPQATLSKVLRVADVELDLETYQVKRAGERIDMSVKEIAILELLMRQPGQNFTAEAIMQRLWSSDSATSLDTVRSHIRNIRKKLGETEETSVIKSVRNLGYRIDDRP